MDSMEDKLNSILGDPKMMQQIMALAQSLSGPAAEECPAQTEEPRSCEREADIQLLSALRPYLKESRRMRLDRALELLQLLRLLKGNRE